MVHSRQPLGMGARIVAGFLVVLILMVSLMIVTLGYAFGANQRLKNIVQNNNAKTELATIMQKRFARTRIGYARLAHFH